MIMTPYFKQKNVRGRHVEGSMSYISRNRKTPAVTGVISTG